MWHSIASLIGTHRTRSILGTQQGQGCPRARTMRSRRPQAQGCVLRCEHTLSPASCDQERLGSAPAPPTQRESPLSTSWLGCRHPGCRNCAAESQESAVRREGARHHRDRWMHRRQRAQQAGTTHCNTGAPPVAGAAGERIVPQQKPPKTELLQRTTLTRTDPTLGTCRPVCWTERQYRRRHTPSRPYPAARVPLCSKAEAALACCGWR
jgi:hypothetical protein